MTKLIKSLVAGACLIAGASVMTVEAQAMPVQPLTPTTSASSHVETIRWRRAFGFRHRGLARRGLNRRLMGSRAR